MPEWLFGGLVTAGVGITGTVGLVIGYVISARTARATAAQQVAATVAATEKTDTQQLVDQLQEELAGYRKAADARATTQDERMERLERSYDEMREQRDGYRDYAHELRAHIYDMKPPPPPEWPGGLTR